MVNTPLPEVVVVTVWFVELSVRVTVAPGMIAPVGSVTDPWMDARNCAIPGSVMSKKLDNNENNPKNLLNFLGELYCICASKRVTPSAECGSIQAWLMLAVAPSRTGFAFGRS